MSCHHEAPNGKPSLLYAALEQKYGPEIAHDVWSQVQSKEFDLRFKTSDNLQDPNSPRKWTWMVEQDAQGEPTLKWLEQELNLKLPKPSDFKPANQEQVNTISATQNFIETGNPQQWLTVEGKAGTGKTTIVQEAIAPSVAKGKKVLVMALSHKAKLVLTEKLEARFGRGSINSHTIAGALRMKEQEDGTFEPEWGDTPAPIEKADIIIVDEASMVNEEALDLIMKMKDSKAKVIFLGDSGQLPPIRKSGDPNAGKDSPAFNTPHKSQLFERVRQGEESPILPFADLYWNNTREGTAQRQPATAEARVSTVTPKGSLVFAKFSELVDHVLPLYKEAVETNQPNLIKTVVYKNGTRQYINKTIRHYVMGENAPLYTKGDLIIFMANDAVSGLKNSSEHQIISAQQTYTTDGWKTWEVVVADPDGKERKGLKVTVLDPEDQPGHTQHVSQMFVEARKLVGAERGKKFKLAFEERDRFAKIDYAYAITSHKSQGSTYDFVLVGEGDIMSVQPTTNKEKSQSIYTAITRARHAVFMMDGNTTHSEYIPAAIESANKARLNADSALVAPILPAPVLEAKPPAADAGAPEPVLAPQPTLSDEMKLEPGRYVSYDGGTYIITKQNANGTWQIYDPTGDGAQKKKSVSEKNLSMLKSKAHVVTYRGDTYLVTPKNTIISTKTFKAMDWGEENGDRKAILAQVPKPVTTTPAATPDTINVYWAGSSTDNKMLSNLAPRPFVGGDGRYYHSVEHAYQTWKSGVFDPNTYSKYKTAGVKIPGTKEADRTQSVDIMERIMRKSFEQNPQAVEALLATGDATLTHTQDKGIWKKEFPRLLMKLRDEFRQRAESYAKSPQGQYENHSGGAPGGDTLWHVEGVKLGFQNHTHWREPGGKTVDSKELQALKVKPASVPVEVYEEGKRKATMAATALGRKISDKGSHYQFRDWAQAKNADGIFAVGRIVRKGELDRKGYRAKVTQIEGGTGLTAQMAIQEGKPVVVFDENENRWFRWDAGAKDFVPTETPVLTPKYAGIGATDAGEAARKAIQEVYQNTLENFNNVPVAEADYAPAPGLRVETPFPGVVNIPDTGMTVAKANEFLSLLQPQILKQAYIENKAVTANRMFSFGLRWAKQVPNPTELSIQNNGKARPGKVPIQSYNDYTYGYYNTDQNNGALPTLETLQPIIDFIQDKLGIDMSNYDSMLANIYENNSFIHQHRDITESKTASKYPVIVINLGADGGLLFDRATSGMEMSSKDAYEKFAENLKQNKDRIGTLPIQNGGIYAFGTGGVNRFTFSHRIVDGIGNTPTMPIKIPVWAPDGTKIGEKELSEYRITLTFRRSQDLKAGEAEKPAVLRAPTKELPVTVKTREFGKPGKRTPESISQLQEEIRAFYEEAVANPDTTYEVPYEFMTKHTRYANGFTAQEMANLLDRADIPANVRFTPSFQRVMEGSTRRMLEGYGETIPPELISRDAVRVLEASQQLILPKLTAEGVPDGFFSPKEQKEVIDTVVAIIERLHRTDPELKGNVVIRAFEMLRARYQQFSDAKDPRAGTFLSILEARTQIARDALSQLEGMGLQIDRRTVARILTGLRNWERVQNAEISNTGTTSSAPADDQGALVEVEGRLAKDWSEDTFELDPRDTASARMKMFIGTMYEWDRGSYVIGDESSKAVSVPENLATLPHQQAVALAYQIHRTPFWAGSREASVRLRDWADEKFPRIMVKNFLDMGRKADFESLFQDILTSLGDRSQTSTFEEFVQTLKDHFNPTIQAFALELEKQDVQMRNEFMTVMMKQYQPFTMAIFKIQKKWDGTTETTLSPVEANRTNQQQVLVKSWQEEQKLSQLTILGAEGERVLDIERIRTKWIPQLQKAMQIKPEAWSTDENRTFFVDMIGGMLQLAGVGLTKPMLLDMLDNSKRYVDGSPAKWFEVGQNGKPEGPLAIFVYRAAGMINTVDDPTVDENAVSRAQRNNPLYTENKVMRLLARVAARHMPVLHSLNHRNAEGKTVWDWGLNTKLSHQFRAMVHQELSTEFDAAIEDNTFARLNYISEAIRNNPKTRGYMQLTYLDGLKNSWKSEGNNRQGMSDREQFLLSILLFQNRGRYAANFMSLTHSDKTTTPVFKGMPRLRTGRAFAPIMGKVIGQSDSAFFNVFKAEYDRITKHRNLDINSNQYQQGKGLFYLMPHFNYEGMLQLWKDDVITKDDFETLYPAGEQGAGVITEFIRDDVELPVINKVLTHVAEQLVAETRSTWADNSIFDAETNKFDSDYVKKLEENNGLTKAYNNIHDKSEGFEYRDRTGQMISKAEANNILVETAAREYALNHFLFNTAQMQLFYGDPAEAYKGKPGQSQLEQVQKTMAEYAKRLAKDIAPRADLYWGTERTYKSLTLQDVKVSEKYLEDVAALRKAYALGTTNSTDAQEVVTVQEHLDVMFAAGKIPQRVYDAMTQVIRAARGGYYEFKDPEQLAIIMQPQKPLYAHRNVPDDNGVALTDYVKSSAYPLYPPMTKGRPIEQLRRLMEGENGNNIQRADFESARKLGNPKAPATVFTPDGDWANPSPAMVASATKQMSRDGFGLQQEVPYDAEKEAIKTITQLNENIVEGILHLKEFQVPGHGSLNGRAVKHLKEEIRKQMLQRNVDALIKELRMDKVTNQVNPDIVLDKIVEAMRTDTRGNYTLNEMQSVLLRDELRELALPLMFNTAAPKIESLLMGLVNKVVELKMPGKSFVQASSTGYKVVEHDGAADSTILRVGDYDGSPLKAMRPDPSDPKKTLPGQVILPWNFTDEEGNRLPMEQFLTTTEDGRKILDPSKVPPALLQLVGARIPNVPHSSIHPLEVVGFVPENMGDLVLIPAALVKQMGGDFDVDKLYTYRRPYLYNKESGAFETYAKETQAARNVKIVERLGADNAEWLDLRTATMKLLASRGEKNVEGRYDYKVFNAALAEVVDQKYPDGDIPKHRAIIVPKEGEPTPQTIEDLQEQYFDVHWAVLLHPDMLAKVMAPLDRPDLGNESDLLKKTSKQIKLYADPMSQLADFQAGKEAKRLVAMTAWAVKYSARIQQMNLRYGTMVQMEDGSWQPEERYIKVIDEHTGEVRMLGRLSGTARSVYTETDGDKNIGEGNYRSKMDGHIQAQNASVDNAKDRVLDNLNLTVHTYKAVQPLIELGTEDGWAANSKYWTRLITQPILWKFSKLMKEGNDSLSTEYQQDLFERVYAGLEAELLENLTEDQHGTEDIVFQPKLLLEAQTMTGSEYSRHQLAALRLFKELYSLGERMLEHESLFNQDVGGAGKDLFVVMDSQRRYENFMAYEAPILGATEIVRRPDGSLSEAGKTFDISVNLAANVVGQVLPYTKLRPVFDRLALIAGKPGMSADVQRSVLKAFRSLAYTSSQFWWGDVPKERVRLLYGQDSLAKRLLRSQNDWGKDNPFLQRLQTTIGDQELAPDFISYNAASKVLAADKQSMTTGWLYLLLSKDEEQRRLGEDLFRYALVAGGIQDASSFVEFIPAAYLAGTHLAGELQHIEHRLKNTEQYMNEALVAQFLQHNPHLARTVKPDVFGDLHGREYPETFQVRDEDGPALKMDNGAYAPYLSYKPQTEDGFVLFHLNPIGDRVFYTRIDTLGNKFMDEYNGTATGADRSIFTQNRAMAERIPSVFDTLTNNRFMERTPSGEYIYVDPFERIGIVAGGTEAVERSLTALENNATLPEYQRTVAAFLNYSPITSAVKEAESIIGELAHGQRFAASISFENPGENIAGQSHPNGAIVLNVEQSHSTSHAAETFLHEFLHHRLQLLVISAGMDSRLIPLLQGEQLVKYHAFLQKFQSANPGVMEHMRALESLRYEAFNAFRHEIGEERFGEIEQDMQAGRIESDLHLRYYALSNLQEFISHAMTDKATMRYLNSLDSKQAKTFLERVWSMLASVLQAFAEAMGVPIREGSILKEAVTRIMAAHSSDAVAGFGDITALAEEGGEQVVGSEQEAETLMMLMESTYDRPSSAETDGLDWTVTINHSKKARGPKNGKTEKVQDKLLEQRNQLSQALNRIPFSDRERRIAMRTQYLEVKNQVDLLGNKSNVNKIATFGNQQLDWVDRVFNNPVPTLVEVNMALEALNIWEGVVELLWGKDTLTTPTEEYQKLQNRAQALRLKATNNSVLRVLMEQLKLHTGAELTKMDMDEKLQDTGVAGGYFLSLTRAKSLLVNAVASYGTKQANNRDEHLGRTIEHLQALEQRMAAAGLNPEELIEMSDGDEEAGTQGTWGLVSRFTGDWHSKHNSLRSTLENKLKSLDGAKFDDNADEDVKKRAIKKRDAWRDYWKEIQKDNLMVDPKNYVNLETGSRLSSEESTAARERLIEYVGSTEFADELIDKVQRHYEQYLMDREVVVNQLEDNLELADEEKVGLDFDAQVVRLKELRAQELDRWERYHSPIHLINTIQEGKTVNFSSEAHRHIVMIPHKGSAHWNERFLKLQASPEKYSIYEEYRKVLREMISYLPPEVQSQIPENFLPIVPKDSATWLQKVMNKIRNWDTGMLETLTASELEAANRLRPDRIPIMYLQESSRTESVHDRSTDLVRVLEIFSMMALQHKYMGDVLDMISVAENVMQRVNTNRLNGVSEGKPLRHVMDALQYFKDKLVFKKPVEHEGKLPQPIYSINPVEQARIERELKELIKERDELSRKIAEREVEAPELAFDETDPDKIRLEQVEKRLQEIDAKARYVYTSKAVDTLISINQMKALGYNPFAAASNFTFGMISVFAFARGREDFDPTHVRQAEAIMMNSTLKYFTFQDEGNTKARKVTAVMRRVGIMGDIVDTDYGKSNLATHQKSKFVSALSPFNWQKSGDYFSKGVMTIAMLLKKQIKVIEKATGKELEVSAWEALGDDGTWNDKYLEQKEWYSQQEVNEQTEWNKHRDSIRKVSMIIFGNQDKNSPLLAKKSWFLRLAGQFRMSWLPEGIANRWMEEYHDVQLGRTVKGRWRTYGDLGILNSILTLLRQSIAWLPGVKMDPFKELTLKSGKPLSESQVDIENMRRNFAGLAWTAGVTAAILIIEGLGDDDDHKKDSKARRRQLLINMMIRNQQDLTLYSSPSVFNSVSGNLLPASQVIVDYWKATKAVWHYFLEDTSNDKDPAHTLLKKVTRAGIPHPTFSLYNKVETMMTRDIDKLDR